MKKYYHIIDSDDFGVVLNYRQRILTPALTVYYHKNTLDHLRVGISVSKKVGKAHLRVRIRRQVRAMFDLYDSYDKAFDIVVIVRKEFIGMDFHTIYADLSTALDRFLKEEPNEDKN